MSLPYVYTPRPGERVKVDRRGGGTDDAHVSVCAQGAGSIAITAGEVPGVAAGIASAMHEAAGLPAPVILKRPEIVPDGAGETGINVFTVRAEPHLGSVSVRYRGTPAAAVIAPGPARVLAAVIAAYADAAEAACEPDPAEVEELAELMDAEMDRRGRGQFGLYPACARIALQWFREREAAK